LIKKLLVLIVPVAAFAALAFGPLSASSADVIWHCPPGVKDHKYCTKLIRCKVPNLRGKTPGQATTELRIHDCRMGPVKKISGNGVKKGQILKTTPGSGQVRGKGTKVTLFVRK
jgi:PASTA domain